MDAVAAPAAAIRERYLARTPGSRGLFERAVGSLPGGSTRSTIVAEPYSPYVAFGQGPRLHDVDGNVYLDLIGNYTSLILGHAHPAVVAAVGEQIGRGSAFAAPTESEILLAEEIRRRLPSVDLLRFTNSGTEATMLALRAARAFTGRPLVGRFERFYHGTHDQVSADPRGLPPGIAEASIDLPWGDTAAVERGLAGREREVAALIIEPVQGAGGVRPADPAFLRFLRDFSSAHGIVLVFDEVISFRVGPGGMQERVGVRPDLTTLGKIIGGGYPLAAFGGRAEIMEQFDSRRPDALPHGGTFNGHPAAAAAGLATLRELTPAAYERLEALAARLADGVGRALAAAGVRGSVTSFASLFQIDLSSASDDPNDVFLGLLNEGHWIARRGFGAVSTPMTDADVDGFAEATGRVAAMLAR